MAPQKAILSDLNAELIATYLAVRDSPTEITRLLEVHQTLHSEIYYYDIRKSDVQDAAGRAARFIYLNRTCWNGLYRVNRLGIFNVPKDTKSAIVMDGDDINALAQRLQKVELLDCDFEVSINRAGFGDLVYVDPPYTVKHNQNGFLKYNQEIFSWEDQIRLRDVCFAARERGASVIVSNADHISIRELYALSDEICSISRASVISGFNSGRSRTTEMLALLKGHGR